MKDSIQIVPFLIGIQVIPTDMNWIEQETLETLVALQMM